MSKQERMKELDSLKTSLEETVTTDNCHQKLAEIRLAAGISRRNFAKVMGVSESTIGRLEKGETKPSGDFLNRLQVLALLGVSKYGQLSEKQRDNLTTNMSAGVPISVALGRVAGGLVGGLSVAGVASGIAALGGALVGGAVVIGAVPAAAAAATYGVAKALKSICDKNELACKEVDGRWEISLKGGRSGEEDEG